MKTCQLPTDESVGLVADYSALSAPVLKVHQHRAFSFEHHRHAVEHRSAVCVKDRPHIHLTGLNHNGSMAIPLIDGFRIGTAA